MDCELDSHADTCCLGSECAVISVSGYADASGFHDQLGNLKNTPIITGVIAYDDPTDNSTYLLTFHQALHFPTMKRHLINLYQMREAGTIVNDIPLIHLLPEQRNETSHSMICNNRLIIPLKLKEIISYFHTRKPKDEELCSLSHNNIDTTNETPIWDPDESNHNDDENMLRANINNDLKSADKDQQINASSSSYTNEDHCRVIANSKIIRTKSITHYRKGTVSPQLIGMRWGIGIHTAQRTFSNTTQLGVRDFSYSTGSKRLKHTAYQLKHRRLRADVYTDTMFLEVKSLGQNTCGQVFVTDFNWTAFYPLQQKADAHLALESVVDDYGIFNSIIPDNAPELTRGQFKKTALKHGMKIHPVEAWTPNQNHAESAIRELKQMYRQAMIRTNAPAILWDHCMQLMCLLHSHTALDLYPLYGETPLAMLTGNTPDISHLVEFSWYDFVWYSNPGQDGRRLGRWLGPSHDVGQAMCSKILTAKGKVISRTSVWPIPLTDSNDDQHKECVQQFETDLKQALGDRVNGIPPENDNEPDVEANTPLFDTYEDDKEKMERMPEVDNFTNDSYDKLISAKVMLPVSGTNQHGIVKHRKWDNNGNIIGNMSSNIQTDTSMYEVEFTDGHVESYAANLIAENIYEQLDDEGNRFRLIDEIIEHKKSPSAINKDNAEFYFKGKNHK